nr:SUF system NifU family Fe-S cluster assembly protein [Actinomyces sp. UMB0138]
MSDLEQMYQQVILDHARLRYGSGGSDGDGVSHQVNPTCGDEVTLGLSLSDEDKIAKLSWDGSGCSISQASLSIMSSMVEGQSVDYARELYEAFLRMMHGQGTSPSEEDLDLLEDLAAFEGTAKFPARIKCALLGWMALIDSISKAQAGGKGEASESAPHAGCEPQRSSND